MCLSECIYRKHMDKSTLYVLLFCTTNGRWGLIVALIFAEHLNYAPIRCNYFLLCLQAINGANSMQKLKTYHWKCVRKGLGENGMNEACETEMSISWSRGVLKCMIGMKVQCSIRGQREERTQLLERNGAKMEIIYCKHMDKQLHVFYFLNNYWVVGKSWGSSGSGAGQKRWYCAAIIYN